MFGKIGPFLPNIGKTENRAAKVALSHLPALAVRHCATDGALDKGGRNVHFLDCQNFVLSRNGTSIPKAFFP
jgi:hypothetical protein